IGSPATSYNHRNSALTTRRSYIQNTMPITPFLAGKAFEPELIREMSLALETVCEKFGTKLADDPATRVLASKIIEVAQRGARGTFISEMAITELKHYHLPDA